MRTNESQRKQRSPTDIVLGAYFGRRTAKRTLESAYETLKLDGEQTGDFTQLEAAVSSVLLKSVLHELPQWAVIRNGKVTLGRKATRSKRTAFSPQHLFTLNWADSGPGFSWPMAYYATAVPAHRRVVVTASADCPETFGFCDVALGHFAADTEMLAGARNIIVAHWSALQEYEQERWAYLFDEGLVSAQLANEWADVVWSAESDEEA